MMGHAPGANVHTHAPPAYCSGESCACAVCMCTGILREPAGGTSPSIHAKRRPRLAGSIRSVPVG